MHLEGGLEETEPYYGFSRFAVELNEVTSVERSHIPPTDARLRPDQKALEEGRVGDAENIKLRVEQAQRDRRRQREIDQVYIFFLVVNSFFILAGALYATLVCLLRGR